MYNNEIAQIDKEKFYSLSVHFTFLQTKNIHFEGQKMDNIYFYLHLLYILSISKTNY